MNKFDEDFSRYYVETDSNVLIKVSAPLKIWRKFFKIAYKQEINDVEKLEIAILDLSSEDCDCIYGDLYNDDYAYDNINMSDFIFITAGEDGTQIEVSDEFLDMVESLKPAYRQTAYAELDEVNAQTVQLEMQYEELPF